MCEDKIIIPEILQFYVSRWYHMYLLHPGMERKEAMIRQHLYWPVIRNSVRKEVTDFDTCQCTNCSNIKYGKLPAKEDG